MSSELLHTIEAIGREKGLDPDVIIEALEEAYAAATRKYYKAKEEYGARFDRKSGEFSVFSKQIVVDDDDLADPRTEITLAEAQALRSDAQLGEVIETAITNLDAPLTRIAAQAAKQVIYQKVKEAEREVIWREYGDRIGELFTGQVKRFDRGDMIVDLGRTEGVVLRREQSRAEHYNPGDRIRMVLIHVERLGKGPQLLLSRASELLVKKLFEMEVPEIYDGTVSIVSVARDPGERSKVAVRSKDRDVDAVGACVGMKGSRVQAVIRELRGEKIDIVQFDEDSSNYVRNALNPAVINRVAIQSYDDQVMEVIVSEDQLSLAIGKRGQNVRLAGKLVGWNLDIKSESEKKAEVEAEMERMAAAAEELGSLPGIDEKITNCLLDAGFLTVEEVSLASLEDLTTIPGIDEETAIELHDSAEEAFEAQLARAAEEEAERAEGAEEAEALSADSDEAEQPEGEGLLDAAAILAADDALSAGVETGVAESVAAGNDRELRPPVDAGATESSDEENRNE
jgi:N utilization substance protein A